MGRKCGYTTLSPQASTASHRVGSVNSVGPGGTGWWGLSDRFSARGYLTRNVSRNARPPPPDVPEPPAATQAPPCRQTPSANPLPSGPA